MKVEKMNSTPECVTKTPEIEAREKLAAIFSDAEQRGDNSKVNLNWGRLRLILKILPRWTLLIMGRLIFVIRHLVAMEKVLTTLTTVRLKLCRQLVIRSNSSVKTKPRRVVSD